MHTIYHSSNVSWYVIARAIFMSIVLLVATAGIVRGQTTAFEVKDGVTSLLKVETDGDVIVSGTITPDVDSAKNLGASLFRWDVLFTDFGDISNDLEIGGDLFAKINNTSDLGNVTRRWKKIWSVDLDASGTISSAALTTTNITVTEDIFVQDDIIVTDVITVGGRIQPASNGVSDIGTSAARFREIFATNGTINTSDQRLKRTVVDLPYGLHEVLQLHPVSYIWKNHPDQGVRLGLIAQEVQPLMSEVVHVGDDPEQTLGLYYSDLIPVLIKSIQEQQAIIDQQQAQFDTLAATLEHLAQTRSRPNNSMAGLLGSGLCLLLVLVSVGRNKRRPIATVE